ncbi:MAG: phosphoribosylformylglycinamidine cyclo-ligase [Elusimicrobia bacterium]|nr:phosphoribosylformylglycinamidine cyclo-ligase [Elusimicrobiota bacterium]
MNLTYKKSGVDIELADKLVDFLQKKSPAIGGFSGLFPIPADGGDPWRLVACTDGVGTKLKFAFALDRHDTIGIDLVAMCVNDLITCGARPMIFLDYYATGRLDLKRSKRIMAGILEGCRQGRSMLLGGETAEMPGFYPPGEYDLAGFSVGIVKKSEVIDGSKIFPGDLVLGLPSSGLHSNGFSLVRKVFTGRHLRHWGPRLLTPTRIYVDQIDRLACGLREKGQIILGLAHITGGGLVENVPRILPKRCRVVLYRDSWKVPEVFTEVRRRGNVPETEMWRTFNMGIGMVVVIRPDSLNPARKLLPQARLIGEVRAGKPEVELR